MSANYFRKLFMPQFNARLSVAANLVKHNFLNLFTRKHLFHLKRLIQKFRQMIQQRGFADDQFGAGFLGRSL